MRPRQEVDDAEPWGSWEEAERRGAIEAYNRDDCLSTLRLRAWLEALRAELEEATGEPVPRPAPGDPEPSDTVAEQHERVVALVDALAEDVPGDEEARTPAQHARWLLAQLLGWHRREEKSTWWEYFRALERTDEELVEDGTTLGGLTYQGVVGKVKQSLVHRYRFPPTGP